MCTSWPLESQLLEYIYALLSLGPFIFDIRSILSPVLGPSTDPSVRIGGITSPYHAHRFGDGHLPSSTPFMEDFFTSLGLYTSGHPHGGGGGCVNVGSTPYFPFYVPSFTALFPLGVFVMIIPPYSL